jgi:DNA-binding response OmpR family regulator
MRIDRLAGRRVLVVEDEALIALMQASFLEEAGCIVLGPARRVADALRIIDGGAVDAGVLDINLGDEKAFPIAEALHRRAVPFVFVTGYGSNALPRAYRDHPCLLKPCDGAQLLDTLIGALEGRPEVRNLT